MKVFLIIVTALIPLAGFAQQSISDQLMRRAGHLLNLEKASWKSTDLLSRADRGVIEELGGYVSYLSGDSLAYTTFYSRSDSSKVLFRAKYNLDESFSFRGIELHRKKVNDIEAELIQLRSQTVRLVGNDSTNYYKPEESLTFNAIPLIDGDSRLVYIMSASATHGEVILGGDYRLKFNESGELISRKKLHSSTHRIPYNNPKGSAITSHSHDSEPFITATDIVTMMLYNEFTDWSGHSVFSDEHVSLLDLNAFRLDIFNIKDQQKIIQRLVEIEQSGS